MKVLRKSILIWVVTVAACFFSFLLPHNDIDPISFLINSLYLFLFIVSIFIVRREPTRRNKFIFLNFSLWFGLSVLFHLNNFVGPIFFPNEPNAGFYFTEYVFYGLYYFLLALPIVYVTVDLLFQQWKIYRKYMLALLVVGSFFGYYYHSHLINPRYSYTQESIKEYKLLHDSFLDYRRIMGVAPSPLDLAKTTPMFAWENGRSTRMLSETEVLSIANQLYPYVSTSNHQVLVYRPLQMNSIYMLVVCVGFIILFFGYQYVKDPPQGAYIEKIMFLFLLFSTIEIMHLWTFMDSPEWATFVQLYNVSQYISAVIIFLVAIFFVLRLRFITSVQGEFYEQEILTSPTNVTRWRDGLDDLLIKHFFKPKYIIGRMFARSSEKLTSEAQLLNSPKT